MSLRLNGRHGDFAISHGNGTIGSINAGKEAKRKTGRSKERGNELEPFFLFQM